MNAPKAVTIVGTGPAGLIAAERLALAEMDVTVHERMPSPARKFLFAGRGGLNLTHSEELGAFLTRYGPAGDLLTPAITAFPPEALGKWSEGLGEPVFTGTSGRIFPKHFKTTPLLRSWLKRLDKLGVRIVTRSTWTGFDAEGSLTFEEPDGMKTVKSEATLLALGGASWPRLGSDGRWTGILSANGVKITPLQPVNCGFKVAWSDFFRDKFQGEPLKRIALSFEGMSPRGEALVTAEGLEGGAIYALSGRIRERLASAGTAQIQIDLRPDLDVGAIIQRLSGSRGSQSMATFLRKALKLPPVAIALLHEGKRGSLPSDPSTLAQLIKAVPLNLTGVRPIERAISSAGGIALGEINGSYMLKSLPGIFVAGEMLDWDAPTGGYLLQGAFSTGLAAANGMLAWLDETQTPAES
jgi:uncharacterized flavoprotein (TIGR03862 family)